MKHNDVAAGDRYQQGVLAELTKMAKAKKQIEHLNEEIWLSLMLSDWELAHALPTRQSSLPAKLAFHEQYYATLKQVMPPTSVFLKELADSITFEKSMVTKMRK